MRLFLRSLAGGLALLALVVVGGACTSFGAVYPPRPPGTPGAPVADPAPSRVVAHISVTSAGLKSSLDESVPRRGEGAFALLRTQRKYTWERSPLDVSFSQGRIVLDAHIKSTIDMPVSSLELPLDVHVVAEPVVSTEYKVKLQSLEVKVTSSDRRLKVADHVAGVFDLIAAELTVKLKEFAYDVKPVLEEAYTRISKPIDLPIGEAKGCAILKVLGIEAGPTIVADGLEKDVALVVAPEVTLPCSDYQPPPLHRSRTSRSCSRGRSRSSCPLPRATTSSSTPWACSSPTESTSSPPSTRSSISRTPSSTNRRGRSW